MTNDQQAIVDSLQSLVAVVVVIVCERDIYLFPDKEGGLAVGQLLGRVR